MHDAGPNNTSVSKSVVRIHLLEFDGPTSKMRASTDITERESMTNDVENIIKEEKDRIKADEILKNFFQHEIKKRTDDRSSLKDNFEEATIELEQATLHSIL